MSYKTDDLLTLEQVAELLGVKVTSARVYHWETTRRRREGRERPQDMPAPVLRFSRTPLWAREDIEAWLVRR